MKYIRLLVLTLGGLGIASADTLLTFTCITNNSGSCSSNVAPFFTATISDLGGGSVQFLFQNSHDTGTITDIYFDEGDNDFFSAFSHDTANSSANTVYSFATGGALPGGNPVGFTSDHQANPGSPATGPNGKGVLAGGYLSLIGTLNGFTYDQFIAGLSPNHTTTTGFRVGFHVQSLPESEGLVPAPMNPNSRRFPSHPPM
jgi:hypothetical protein